MPLILPQKGVYWAPHPHPGQRRIFHPFAEERVILFFYDEPVLVHIFKPVQSRALGQFILSQEFFGPGRYLPEIAQVAGDSGQSELLPAELYAPKSIS